MDNKGCYTSLVILHTQTFYSQIVFRIWVWDNALSRLVQYQFNQFTFNVAFGITEKPLFFGINITKPPLLSQPLTSVGN